MHSQKGNAIFYTTSRGAGVQSASFTISHRPRTPQMRPFESARSRIIFPNATQPRRPRQEDSPKYHSRLAPPPRRETQEPRARLPPPLRPNADDDRHRRRSASPPRIRSRSREVARHVQERRYPSPPPRRERMPDNHPPSATREQRRDHDEDELDSVAEYHRRANAQQTALQPSVSSSSSVNPLQSKRTITPPPPPPTITRRPVPLKDIELRRIKTVGKIGIKTFKLLKKTKKNIMDVPGKKFGTIILDRPLESHERLEMFNFLRFLNEKNHKNGVQLPDVRCEFVARDEEEVDYLFNERYEQWYIEKDESCEKVEAPITVTAPPPPPPTRSVVVAPTGPPPIAPITIVNDLAIPKPGRKQAIPHPATERRASKTTPVLRKRSLPEDAPTSMFGVVKKVKTPVYDESPVLETRPTNPLPPIAPERPIDIVPITTNTTRSDEPKSATPSYESDILSDGDDSPIHTGNLFDLDDYPERPPSPPSLNVCPQPPINTHPVDSDLLDLLADVDDILNVGYGSDYENNE